MSENLNDVNKNNLPKRPPRPMPPSRPVPPEKPVPPAKPQAQATDKPVQQPVANKAIPKPLNAEPKVNNEVKETKPLKVESKVDNNVDGANPVVKKIGKSKKVVFISIMCSVLTIALASVILYMFILKPSEHTITYLDVDMQTVYETTTMKHGDKIESLVKYESDNPNLIFMGWYLDDSYSDRITIGTKIEKDYVFYPKFRYEYKVTYKAANLIDIYKVEKFDHDDLVILEDGPTNSNEFAVFKGWYTDTDFTNRFTFGGTIDKDYTLYPLFENEYHITYKGCDLHSIYKVDTLGENDIPLMPVAPTHTNPNAVFKGWYYDNFSVKFDFTKAIDRHYTLYPLFELEYTITYMDVDQTSVYKTEVYSDTQDTVEPTAPTHTNEYAVFKGWYTDSQFNTLFVFESTINQDYTLYPLFEIEYRLTYFASDLVNTYKVEIYGEGEATIEPTAPTNDNQYAVFKGWYLDSEFNNKFTFGSAMTDHYTLYPLFVIEYKITYLNADQTTTYKEEIYGEGEVTVAPSAPTHENEYAEFVGWYEDSEYTIPFTFGNAINKHYTLYPLFNDAFTITYKAINLTSDYKTETYKSGEVTVEPVAPAHENEYAEFVGWFIDDEFENIFTFGDVLTSNITLYPLFENFDGLEFTEVKDGDDVIGYSVAQGHFDGAELVVPATYKRLPVLKVSANAFYKSGQLNRVLTSVVLPDSITVIEDCAFYGCMTLNMEKLPQNLEKIGGSAFIYCEALTLEELPDSLNEIEYFAFAGSGIEITSLPSGITEIGASVFRDCKNITTMTLPNTVETLGDYAFYDCINLESIELSSGLTSIGGLAFYACEKLKKINLPQGLENIGGGVFTACSMLTEISIPASVTSIGAQIILGAPITKIKVDAANQTYSDGNGNAIIEKANNKLIVGCLTTVIPSSVVTIGANAFKGVGINYITIPESVQTIEANAFDGCANLKVAIVNGLTTLASKAFNACGNLNYFLVSSQSFVSVLQAGGIADSKIFVKTTSGYDGLAFENEIESTIKMFVDNTSDYNFVRVGESGSYEYYQCINYKNESGLEFTEIKDGDDVVAYSVAQGSFSGSELTIPASFQGKPVIEITESGFEYNTTLTKVVIPDSVEVIGAEAFQNCTNLEVVKLPENITLDMGAFHNCVRLDFDTLPSGVVIGYMAFSGCISLTLDSLPSSVTEIGEMAFIDCTSLNLTSLSASLKVIGKNAFKNCTSLENLTLPSGLETINGYAFDGCSNLNITSIPSSVTSLSRNVFNNCVGLISVAIECNITNIPVGLFNGCTNLASVTMPSGVEVIGDDVFKGCALLNLTSLPSTITSIGSNAFNGCTNLTLSSLPSALISIGNSAFKGCAGLTISSLPSTITTIGSSAFNGCTGITISTIPSGVETINSYSFSGCNGITFIVIPNSVKSIGASAFASCKSLRYVELSSTIESLGQWSFNECSALKVVVIPALIQSLDTQAFILSTNYEYVLCGSDEVATMLINNNVLNTERRIYIKQTSGYESLAFGENFEVTTSLTLKVDKTSDYTWVQHGDNYYQGIYFNNVSGLAFTEIKEDNKVVAYSVGQGTFAGTELVIPSRYHGKPVTAISDDAFVNNDIITSIVLPKTITKIGDHGFYGCINLELSELPSGITSIGEYAFSCCFKISLTSLPVGLEVIEDYTFERCTELALESLPSGITSIGDSAFHSCTNLALPSLPSGVEAIGEYAFSGCTSIEWTSLPSGVTSIGKRAFNGCTSLALTNLPSGITVLEDYVFNKCENMTLTSLPNGIISIGETAFNECKKIALTSLPSTLQTIGKQAFLWCENLAITSIPSGVTSIGTYAFYGSKVLKLVKLPSTISSIGASAFNGNNSLVYVLCESAEVATLLIDSGLQESKVFVKQTSGYESLTFSENEVINSSLTIAKDSTNNYLWIKDGESYYKCVIDIVSSLLLFTPIKDGDEIIAYSVGQGSFNGSELVLPATYKDKPITAITKNGFKYNQNLTSIVLSDNITILNDGAFSNCSNLKDIQLPDGLVEIGPNVFSNCSKLELTSLPSSVTTIGPSAFYLCSKLALTNLPSGLTKIDSWVFQYCSSLAITSIPSGVVNIFPYAFDNCTNLVLLKLPSTITGIGEKAFNNTTALNYILCESESLVEQLINRGVSEDRIYVKKSSGYESLEFGESVEINSSLTLAKDSTGTYIWLSDGENYYKGVYNQLLSILTFTEIKEGNNVVAYSVSKGSFDGEELEIPGMYNGMPVTEIADSGFSDMFSLEIVTLPDSITAINYKAFYCCPYLTTINGSLNNLTTIGDYAFYDCSKLELAELPNTVTTIGDGAFAGCRKISFTSLPSNIQSVGVEAFGMLISIGVSSIYCDNIKILLIPTGIQTIGRWAFSGINGYILCPNDRVALLLQESYTSESEIYVKQTTGYESLSFSESEVVNESLTILIDDSTGYIWVKCGEDYYKCIYNSNPYNLEFTQIIEEGKVVAYSVGQGGFTGTELELPGDYRGKPVTAITANGFKSNTTLTSISLPYSITNINEYGFYQCTNLVNIVLPDTITNIGQYGFHRCSKLVINRLPYELKTIGNRAFVGCKKLNITELPYGLVSIGEHAFDSMVLDYCSSIKILNIPTTVTQIGTEAFDGCNNLIGILCENEEITTLVLNAGTDEAKIFVKQTTGYESLAFSESVQINDTLSISLDKTTEYVWLKISESYYKCYFDAISLSLEYTPVRNTSEQIVGYSVGQGSFTGATLTLPATRFGKPVSQITADGFKNNTTITSITFTDEVRKVQDYAFYGCTNLSKVDFGDSVYLIGAYAFAGCESLNLTYIPRSMMTIEESAFGYIEETSKYCSSIKILIMFSLVDSVGANAFSGLNNIKYILTEGSASVIRNKGVKDELIFQKYTSGYSSLSFSGKEVVTSITLQIDTTTDYKWVKYFSNYFKCCVSDNPLNLAFNPINESGNTVAYSVGKGSFTGSSLTIPATYKNKPVTTISNNGFSSLSSLTTVNLPDTIVEIGSSAFKSCSKLTNINLPSSLKTMGNDVFYNCSKLALIDFPQGVTSLGLDIFYGCTSLPSNTTVYYLPIRGTSNNMVIKAKYTSITSVTWPENVVMILDSAFANCSSLVLTELPNALVEIRYKTFYRCSKLALTSLPSGITEIGLAAFESCPQIKLSSLPSGLSKIKDYTFYGCTNLALTSLPSGITEIGADAFYECSNLQLTSIPNTVTTISDGAFVSCTKLNLTSLPSGLTRIGDAVFYGCTSLALTSLPNSVTYIARSAFYECTNLALTSLSTSLTEIGSYSFYKCNKLAIKSLPNADVIIAEDSFKDCTVLPSNNEVYYLGVSGTSNNVIVKAKNTSITKVTWPSNVVRILYGAFSGCSSLAITSLPNTITTLDSDAFKDCTSLALTSLPKNIVKINTTSFEGCTSLPSNDTVYYLPLNGTSNNVIIKAKNTAITSVTWPSKVTMIADGAFASCSSLVITSLPSTLTTIGDYAFYYCRSIDIRTLPSTLKTISSGAFAYCTSLTSITIPTSVTSIGDRAFEYSSLVALIIPGNITNIGSDILSGVNNIEYVLCDYTATANAISNNHFSIDKRDIYVKQTGTTLDGVTENQRVINDSLTIYYCLPYNYYYARIDTTYYKCIVKTNGLP